MTDSISKAAADKFSPLKRASTAIHGRGAGVVVDIGRNGSTGIYESWVRPDGTIERNIKMDLVVAAAGKRTPTP